MRNIWLSKMMHPLIICLLPQKGLQMCLQLSTHMTRLDLHACPMLNCVLHVQVSAVGSCKTWQS